MINVDSEVLESRWETFIYKGQKVTGWNVAEYAAGWHYDSVYPGHQGNCVISGHNNFRGEVFRDLYKVQPGDDVYLYVGEEEYHYVVKEAFMLKEKGEPEEVRFRNAQWIAPTADERLTLVSCWPYLTATHRVIVIGQPAP